MGPQAPSAHPHWPLPDAAGPRHRPSPSSHHARPLTSLSDPGRASVSSTSASSTCWVSLRAADRPCSCGSRKASWGSPTPAPAPPQGPLTSQRLQQVEDRPGQLVYQRPAVEHQALEDGACRTAQRLCPPGAQALLQLGAQAGSEPGWRARLPWPPSPQPHGACSPTPPGPARPARPAAPAPGPPAAAHTASQTRSPGP